MGDSGKVKATEMHSVPIFTGLAWPLVNIVGLMGLPTQHGAKVVAPDLKPYSNTFAEYSGAMTNSLRSFAVAYFAVFIVHGGDDGFQYAAFGKGAEWDWAWMWPILLRNLIGMWVMCGFWDYLLYFSPLAAGFKPYKINEDYPTLK